MRHRAPLLWVATAVLVWPPALAVSAEGPTCFGEPATIVGTERSEVLIGTDGPDVVWAGPGYDRVIGKAGDDVICLGEPGDPIVAELREDDFGDEDEVARGGRGRDQIGGGPGLWNDISGGSGDDELWAIGAPPGEPRSYTSLLWGGPGDDVLHGRATYDELAGRGGNDVIQGMGGPDDLEGDRGDDRVDGGPGDDFLLGGSDSDRLDGGPGDDLLFGDRYTRSGVVRGTSGDDVLLGGDGRDDLHGQGGSNQNNGGEGSDGCSYPADGDEAVSCERTLTEPVPPGG